MCQDPQTSRDEKETDSLRSKQDTDDQLAKIAAMETQLAAVEAALEQIQKAILGNGTVSIRDIVTGVEESIKAMAAQYEMHRDAQNELGGAILERLERLENLLLGAIVNQEAQRAKA